MKKKLVSFVCAVMAALCLVVSVPMQAYAAPEDEIAPQYIGICRFGLYQWLSILPGNYPRI